MDQAGSGDEFLEFGHEWCMGKVMSTFDNQSMSIGCVGKLGHLFGFLRHYLLRIWGFLALVP